MNRDKKLSFIINFIYFLLIAAILFFVVKYALPMVAPFVVSFFVAYIMRKPTCFVSRKFRLPQKPVAMLMVLLFYGTIGLLITLLILRAVAGIESLVAFLPKFYESSIVPVVTDTFTGIENFV